MTNRERSLALVLVAVIGVGLLGFIGYQFVLGPMLEKDRQIKLREGEVAQLELTIQDILIQKRKFEATRMQSLPTDPRSGVGVSREEYGKLLEGLCRRSDLTTGLKIIVSEPDNKSVPMLGPKKPAYTRLSYEVTAKGELYHLVDFLRQFYNQPLLHQVKKINILRPSDARAQGEKHVDVTMTVEALVLDNAPARPTLLPVIREMALLSGPAAYTGYNMVATTSGKGSPVPPAGVLAEPSREYLSIAGRNVFFGPPPKTSTAKAPRPEPKAPPEEDLSPFITLTSVIGSDDGMIVASFRDKATNNDYTVTQNARGAIGVVGEYELNGKPRLLSGYSREKPAPFLTYGTDEGRNRRIWRVRRVLLDAVIVEQVDVPTGDTKPRPPALAGIAGGVGAVVAVPEGKIYRVEIGQSLVGMPDRPSTVPVKYLLTREAWKDIYTAPPVPAAAVGSGAGGS